MKRSIIVRWDFIGFHKYDGAPETVSFLQNRHRHLFKCSAQIEVRHDNRELEFFMVQDRLKRAYHDHTDVGSCEMVADDVIGFLQTLYGKDRSYKVEVSEDGENSAVVES